MLLVGRREDSGQSNCRDDGEKDCRDSSENLVVDTSKSVEKTNDHLKRKRESLLGMLSWVLDVAKHPDDPAIGKVPKPSKWKENGRHGLWMQVIMARNVLQQKQFQNLGIRPSISAKRLTLDPTLHDGHQYSEKFRCREHLPILVKFPLCSCCYSFSSYQQKFVNFTRKRIKNGFNNSKLNSETEELECSGGHAASLLPASVKHECLATKSSYMSTIDEPCEEKIGIGSLFQAEVPEWTDKVPVSDSKWLGTKIWGTDYKATFTSEPVRNRKNILCTCSLPGSVECFRFHIAENRMKLKLELGSAFYAWKFDSMGEEVSLQWTADEERRFLDIVRSNRPCLGQCFWDDIFMYFPKRLHKNLVNYYFNVFVVRRRSYQNRVTPKDIDSDDDDSEFGSCGVLFGHKAINMPISDSFSCSLNEECSNFE